MNGTLMVSMRTGYIFEKLFFEKKFGVELFGIFLVGPHAQKMMTSLCVFAKLIANVMKMFALLYRVLLFL